MHVHKSFRLVVWLVFLVVVMASLCRISTWFWFDLISNSVAKVLWTLCYASPEEIAELQRPRHATGNRRNLQCGDDSIMWANATCLAWVQWGPRSGGSALLVVGFSVLVSILLCSLSMSGAALSTRLSGALRFRGSCSLLGERNGSWIVGYLCSCTECAVTRHLVQ